MTKIPRNKLIWFDSNNQFYSYSSARNNTDGKTIKSIRKNKTNLILLQ